jgi:hypothetical protein
VKKRSPRGLFNINEMAFNISSEDWVLTCIEDGEVWARTTLEKAGIQIAAGSELSLTSKRSTADPVHQAAVTLFQARKLREWLKQSQDAGGLASWQAFQSAFRMGQFLFAAFSGTLIEVEPLLDTGRKVRFGGQDGARAASENIHEKFISRGTGVIPERWYRRHTRKRVLLVPASYPTPPFSVVPASYLPFKSKPYRGEISPDWTGAAQGQRRSRPNG